MKQWCAAVMAAAFAGSAWAAGPPVTPNRYLVEIGVFQGDPLGSKKEGTLDVLSRPTLGLLEGQAGRCSIGQEVQVGEERLHAGITTNACVERAAGGRVSLRIGVEVADLEFKSDDEAGFRVARGHFVREAALGQTLRLRVRGAAAKVTWIEATVKDWPVGR